MIDWNALAEKHKLGSTDVERTVTLLCREMAKLVPQELPMPGERLVSKAPIASIEGEEAASG